MWTMARPQKFTPQQIIEALHATKGMITLAADRLRCGQETVARYVKRYPTVAAALKIERARMTDAVELVLYSAAMKGEPWAVMFYLRTMGKERGYTERVDLHHVIAHEVERIRNDLDLTEEEKVQLIRDVEDFTHGRGR